MVEKSGEGKREGKKKWWLRSDSWTVNLERKNLASGQARIVYLTVILE